MCSKSKPGRRPEDDCCEVFVTKKLAGCRICGNRELVEVLDLGIQALTGVFPQTKSQPVTSGPLRLVKCMGADVCGLLQLQHSYDLSEMYGLNYGYRSGLNQSMVEHLHGKVRAILPRVELGADSLVIDIGSNDSTTLQAYPRTVGNLVGIDPTGIKFGHYYPDHIKLIPEFFSARRVREAYGSRKATVITSFSMFYDLEEPLVFMQDVFDSLDDEGIWVFEQSYMPTMLRQNSYDTVCHEHLEYYGLKQIQWMAKRVGLTIVDVEFNDVNGGSFSVVAAKTGSRQAGNAQAIEGLLDAEKRLGLDTLQPYLEFAARTHASRESLVGFIDSAIESGKTVSALGASTKGNVLLQYCGLDERRISRVGEVNETKFGCFTPGSLIPIVPEQDLLESNPDHLLVLPWHFRSFFEELPSMRGRNLLFPLPMLESVRPS
jgi:NDP-4-keto-2,6-dideoxyhexose 3-C-methyltransferase